MKERRKPQDRRASLDERRQGERRQGEQCQGRRRKDYCPKCGRLLNLTGRCPVCKVRVIRIR